MRFILVTWLFLASAVYPCDGSFPNRCDAMYTGGRAQREANQLGMDIRQGRMLERTNAALNAMIRLGAYRLRKAGHDADADILETEWDRDWNGYIYTVGRGLGDHRPMSQWLAMKYAMLEFILGEKLCRALRLDDIKVVNFALPVVFACVDNVSETEYGLHFIPLSGVIGYWTSFFVCVGGTWGTGFLWCGPIALGVEFLSVHAVAPALNRPVWGLFCKGG